MEKLCVGMYVRHSGQIFKFDGKDKEFKEHFDKGHCKNSKASYNIIDLIEPNDFIIVKTYDTMLKKYTKIGIQISDFEHLEDIVTEKEFEIISILTHEQYRRHCCKIKGE